jgi:hypothetical protein
MRVPVNTVNAWPDPVTVASSPKAAAILGRFPE